MEECDDRVTDFDNGVGLDSSDYESRETDAPGRGKWRP